MASYYCQLQENYTLIQLCPLLISTFGMLQIVSCLTPTCPANSDCIHACSVAQKWTYISAVPHHSLLSAPAAPVISILFYVFSDFFKISDCIQTNTYVELMYLCTPSQFLYFFHIIFKHCKAL